MLSDSYVSQKRTHLTNMLLLSTKLAGIIIVDLLKSFPPIGEVARVNADLFESISYHHSHGWLKVDVSH